ncbi:hypothetical protein Gohar_009361 [Gossypium harknessii]|uniref:DUF4283 domain-containing protein n=1 Tax=Gossypium harknessii TaxID=34285 RepID=A0A7J9GML0_9ROSI|nr:hypothetical protein [Gossypium harknessii]
MKYIKIFLKSKNFKLRRSDNRQSKEGVVNIQERDANVVMETNLAPNKPRSWKDCLIGTGLQINDKTESSTRDEDDDDLDLFEDDIVRTSVNGIPAIEFSNRVNQLLIKDMEHTFQNFGDFERVLSQGPWIVYGQYLTVQPWSIEFNPSQPYPEYGHGLDTTTKIAWTYVQKENTLKHM